MFAEMLRELKELKVNTFCVSYCDFLTVDVAHICLNLMFDTTYQNMTAEEMFNIENDKKQEILEPFFPFAVVDTKPLPPLS